MSSGAARAPRTARFDAFAAGDLAAVRELSRPDAVWHAQRLGLLGGDHEGWPAVAAFFDRTMELTNGSFSVTIEDVLTDDSSVAAVARSRGERDGRRLDDRQVHLFRLENGLVAEVWQFPGEDTVAFWS